MDVKTTPLTTAAAFIRLRQYTKVCLKVSLSTVWPDVTSVSQTRTGHTAEGLYRSSLVHSPGRSISVPWGIGTDAHMLHKHNDIENH